MAHDVGTDEDTAQVSPLSERDQERMRRRFARRQWARRWGVWRPLAALLVLLVLLAAGVWVVWFSTLLAVDRVQVRGTDHLEVSEVLEAAAVPSGRPLVRVDLDAATRRVEALAAVREARVERSWPGTVLVTVVERESVAVAQIGDRVAGIDREGVVFRTYRKAPADLPRVRVVGDVDRDALAEAALVVSSLPDDLAAEVRRIDVETIDKISLLLKGRRTVVWGSGEDSALKADVLAALVKAQQARTYDVSVPGSPVTSG